MGIAKWFGRGLQNALGTIWAVVVVLPIYYMVLSSFRSQGQYYADNPLTPKIPPNMQGYELVVKNNIAMYFGNSIFVTLATVAVLLVVTIMASYVITRGSTVASKRIFSLILLGLAIPGQATIVPLYYLINVLRLYDNLWALILPGVAFAIPITVLILVNFMRDIPRELFESMRLDGVSEMWILVRLVLPLARPAIVTVAIYDALQVWNSYLFPLVLTQSKDKQTLPLSLATYSTEHGANVPAVLAAVILSALPMLAAYIVGRRQLIAGLTAGFGK